ncbi:DNA ligase 1-like [Brassica napus]|uniref:DNA ligase 1-like n=1 Tax=Brassica napus TaxID=3708 RepID=UPI00207ADF59|nr:DNA ligase 1-like [Brassica napus]
MCKSRFTKSSMKGYPLEDIYAALGHTKVINSVLVPTVGEEIMLARIIDEEREYHCEGSTSDTWNHWLNVKQKKIFWKELYDLDVAARVFKKKKDKEKVTFLEDSSSKSGLESLKALEEKILGAMSEGFSGLKSVVEAKLGDMDVRMSKFEKNQRQLRRRAKKIEEKLTSIESNKNEERNYGEDMDFGWDDRDYGRAEGKENSEKAKEDKENSESGEEKDVVSGGENSKDGEKENNEKGEEEKDQEPEKDKENSDSVEKGEEYVEESDGESSLLRLQERVRVQAEEFWRTIDDESEAEEEVEKEGEEEAEKEVQEEKEGEKEAEKEVQEEKEGEKEAEKEAEKEVQEEKEAEKVESKGTPTSTGVIVITPHGRTKAAAARKAISISPEIVVVTGIAELAEKEVEVEATQTEQEAIQTEIVEKEAEVTEKDAELAEKEDQDVDEEEEKAEESEDNPVESPSEKHAELAEKSVESDVDLDVEEEEEKDEEIKDNLVESPAKKQTELAEKSVEVELKTKRKPKVKVIAVPYGIPRAERLAKMRAEAEKKKARAEKKKAKADGAPKKKGRPKKTEATLKPCTPLLEKRKSEPSRWVQSPFTEGKTDELEVPKKKLKTKT